MVISRNLKKFKRGDIILSVEGQSVYFFQEVYTKLRRGAKKVTIQRGNQTLTMERRDFNKYVLNSIAYIVRTK